MNEINPARPPVGEPDSRKAFWHACLDWLATASEGDLEELASVLTANVTTEVRPLISALRDAMRQEATRRGLPQSLIRQLQAANWPAAQANE